MPNKGWKQYERRLARALGVERIPVTGERAGADFEDGMFVYQAKKRAGQFPEYLAQWLRGIQAAGERRDPTKTGVVILQRPRALDGDALVIVSFKDWIELHGPGGGEGSLPQRAVRGRPGERPA